MSTNPAKSLAQRINSASLSLGERSRSWQKRSTYLVDRRLQYRIIKQVAVLGLLMATLVLCNIYVLWNLTEVYDQDFAMSSYSLGTNGAVVFYGLLALACNTGISFLGVLFFSHQLVGPSVKIVDSLKRIAHGDLNVHVQLRKADHFKEIADSVNELVDEWNVSVAHLRDTVNTMRDQLAKGQDIEIAQQLAVLEGLLDRYTLRQ
jgi:methyl-accepting chemotaxis protein